MTPLPYLQSARLAWIVAFEQRRGRTPKLREMAAAWHVSIEAARLTVAKLIAKGYLDRGARDTIALRVRRTEEAA